MFAIISRIPPLLNNPSYKKYLYIFVIGALCYLLVHFYLFSYCHGELASKFKSIFYYIIIGDLLITYTLDRFLEKDDYDNGMDRIRRKLEKKQDESPFVKNTESKHEDSKQEESNHENSKQEESKHEESKHEESKHEESKQKTEDPDTSIPIYKALKDE